LRARRDLVELLQGTAHFDEVAQVSTEGVCLLRADDGVEAFVASGAPSAQLFTSFARLSHGFDTLLLAMPAGELACMVSPTEASPLIALTRDGQGLIDAYAGVKSLVEFGFRRFFVAWHADVQAAAHRLSDVARARLGAELLPAGALPTDTVSLNSATFAQTLLGCAAQPLVLH